MWGRHKKSRTGRKRMEILAIFTCHNRRELTKRGIETLSRNENVTFHYVVVDDGSTDGTKEMLQELPEQIAVYEETEEPWDAKDGAYISGKCEDIVAHLAEIDEAIDAVAEGWKTGRMGKVDLTLIRLAVYEMKYDEDVPVGVAINEAVELAKKYGTDESPAFINGVLAKLV